MSLCFNLKIACLICTISSAAMVAVSNGASAEQFSPGRYAENASQAKGNEAGQPANETKEQTPEEKMRARFPQPAKVSDLIGRAVLDYSDNTLGYVSEIVQSGTGKIQLIVPYGRWFGWIRAGGIFNWGRRPVAVPIEAVAALGQFIAAMDMDREAFDNAPTFKSSDYKTLPPQQVIQIALTRR